MVCKAFKAGIVIAAVLVLPGSLYARTHHYSAYSDEPAQYLSAINKHRNAHPSAKCGGAATGIRAGIVTHHFLASGIMAEFFECLASGKHPERIILIGPDHFGKSRARIATSALPWVTPFGEMRSHPATVAHISEALALPEDVEALSGEHSIGILMPFIRYYFPESSVVPIILQKNLLPDELFALKRLMTSFLDDPGTLVLLSMDFVHNQTPEEADRRDELSKVVIEKLGYDQADRLDVDCHPGLKILLSVLNERQDIRVRFLNHTNSARITGEPGLTNVTSYFTVLFVEQSKMSKQARKQR